MHPPETIWNVLHDGLITAVRGGVPGDVDVTVEIEYLTEKLARPCASIIVRLHDCAKWEFLRWEDDSTTVSFTDFLAVERDILSATVVAGDMQVICEGGVLSVRYSHTTLRCHDGTHLPLDELLAAATAYWDAFGGDT
jgi:hypothetical protein